ncbi:hypothetical protein DH2020_044254 [Rehmannia glutinosa]|uniref:Tf2-1-like SH3-like domain-containing protein n=1 Tax=Rehmannia glutinosa TaxID=99300 RepID=A0ABR0UHF6_REHGL
MDFVTDLPKTRGGHDVIWVVVDRLTKPAHFLPIKKTDSLQKLAQIYIREIISYRATIGMAPYEALYGQKCRSPLHWSSDQGADTHGSSRQKSYTDKRRKDLEFEVGDEVFLRLSPRKGLINPKKEGKLSPRYVGPYKILQWIGKSAYRLELPAPYAGMHDVLHVSRLKKYQPDPEHIITRDTPPLMENLSYTERPIRIIDQQVRQLRKREIPMVKVVWQNHNRDEDATWEKEEDIMNQYPELF